MCIRDRWYQRRVHGNTAQEKQLQSSTIQSTRSKISVLTKSCQDQMTTEREQKFLTFLEGTYFLRNVNKAAAAAASALMPKKDDPNDKSLPAIIRRVAPTHRLSILKHSDSKRIFENTAPLVNNEYLNDYSDSDEEEEKRQAQEEDLMLSGNDKDAHEKMKKVPKTENEKAQKRIIDQLQQRVGDLERDVRALKKMKNQLEENEKDLTPKIEQLTKERESYSQIRVAYELKLKRYENMIKEHDDKLKQLKKQITPETPTPRTSKLLGTFSSFALKKGTQCQ
eukprot:TRINITY_DN3365_c0_g1_i1.p1 TRINITY_DN3365_c0_g1~~TRINITY_DN3365_c0_g1_i1.p1  ORF type:complete len:301 (-),score=75.42 TRINITY_DN3365_c0_g1_i1:171-1013(-)